MRLLKYAIYVAAGFGLYSLLRRYGLLNQAGDWLRDNIPENVQGRAQELAGQASDMARQAGSKVGLGGEAGSGEGGDAPAAEPGQQTITGAGRGQDVETSEFDGGTVHHRVGRGVVRG